MSLQRYRLRPAASRELHAFTSHLQIAAGAETATRFVAMAQKTLDRLAETPGLGAPVVSRDEALRGLRKGRIETFPKVLVFYLTESWGIRVIRVLHAASDWQAALDAD